MKQDFQVVAISDHRVSAGRGYEWAMITLRAIGDNTWSCAPMCAEVPIPAHAVQTYPIGRRVTITMVPR